MNLGSIDGPLTLSLSPSEGERVPSGQVRGFRDTKRERPVRGILPHDQNMKRKRSISLCVAACLLAGMCGLASAGEDPRLEYAHALLKQAAKPTVKLKLDESLGHPEAFCVAKPGGKTVIECGSPAGAVYGALAVARDEFVPGAIEKPDFDIRGTTLCLMGVSNTYKVTFSPEASPWFFDRAFMERTLDSFAADRLNTIFLWTCHLFPYIVELPKYPEATELNPTFATGGEKTLFSASAAA